MKNRIWLIALTAALTLNAALWLAAPGLSLPRALQSYLLGPKMVRAEIVLKGQGNTLRDRRIDVGKIRSVSAATQTITLKEPDQLVSISVAPTAHIKVNGSSSSFAGLRPGMHATVFRDGDSPADTVLATK
jgi:hypothetical protein